MSKDMLGTVVRGLVSVPAEAHGTLVDLMEKLSSDSAKWLPAIKKTLRMENPWEPRTFAIWQTIEIGGKSRKQLFAELEAAGIEIGDWARFMMNHEKFLTATEVEKIDLVRFQVQDLGFTETPSTEQIWLRAAELGLELCPVETGPQLRLQFADRDEVECFWIAMNQLADSLGYQRVFRVWRNGYGKRGLGGGHARPDGRWNLDSHMVFQLRKQ